MLTAVNDILNTGNGFLLLLIVLPVLGGVVSWLTRGKFVPQMFFATLFAGLNTIFALAVYRGHIDVLIPFFKPDMDIRFISSGYAGLMLTAGSALFLLTVPYAVSFYRGKKESGLFLLLSFISLAMINGAVLSDNMSMMLFFWEGLLGTLFAILLIGNREKPDMAVKALTVSGICDLLVMFGIVITVYNAGTTDMSWMQKLPVSGTGIAGCVCLLLGAMGKAGAMPFHSWIPDAADNATTPFLAVFPASLQRILGIYLTVRVATQIYALTSGGVISVLMIAIGAVTLFLGGTMALVQNDLKRFLAYTAISQTGYIVLGIGSGVSDGVVGGAAQVLNGAIYLSGLFIVAAAVEKAVGTTDLHSFSGLGKKMPLTCAAFIVFALSAIGFPGFSGFFSYALILNAAKASSVAVYIVVLAGLFLTAMSFLKVVFSMFFGKEMLPKEHREVREASPGMLIPALLMAGACILFGVWNRLPLDQLMGAALHPDESFSGWPGLMTTLIICAVLAVAVLVHFLGRKKAGSSLEAVDRIHNAPLLKSLYRLAEKGAFDPYNWLMKAVGGFSYLCEQIEKGVSWAFDVAAPGLVTGCGALLQKYSNGKLSRYLATAVIGCMLLGVVFLVVLL